MQRTRIILQTNLLTAQREPIQTWPLYQYRSKTAGLCGPLPGLLGSVLPNQNSPDLKALRPDGKGEHQKIPKTHTVNREPMLTHSPALEPLREFIYHTAD